MPTVRISDRNLERLKRWALPLTDTVDMALSKALDKAEGKKTTPRKRTTKGDA